jgi:hypothetical protein
MDVFGRLLANLDTGHPCRHDEALHFHVVQASVANESLRGSFRQTQV